MYSAGLEVTASNYFVEVIVVTCISTLRFNHTSPEELLRQHAFVLHVTREVDFGPSWWWDLVWGQLPTPLELL